MITNFNLYNFGAEYNQPMPSQDFFDEQPMLSMSQSVAQQQQPQYITQQPQSQQHDQGAPLISLTQLIKAEDMECYFNLFQQFEQQLQQQDAFNKEMQHNERMRTQYYNNSTDDYIVPYHGNLNKEASFNSTASTVSPPLSEASTDYDSFFGLSHPNSANTTVESTPLQTPTGLSSIPLTHAVKINPKKPKKRCANEKYSSRPGPIPASQSTVRKDSLTGEELLTFSYSRKKQVSQFSLRCPKIDFHNAVKQHDCDDFDEAFKQDNCIYPGAMVPPEEYHGKRGNYERECNYIGWHLAYANPGIRNERGLIQRAVDSWRNTRQDAKLRSRRVRKEVKKELRKKLTV